ncbi:RHS repeat-associated core domain-containing protein [Caldimonas brevitalea]|uniref:Type IV secretion protein Rhs n=1 Tax=Caldimonas brevitalea TaxID=413882 RepID=A0A0G3BKI5_9BURK|nr:RHS repeat-associated core domain-containing protein [Caldimonas brevitalea]AKJ28503.1 type IV secretion protein Rhs [Caldimonas brevitalea]
MSEPKQTPAAEREPQIAVVPLSAIAQEDVGAGAAAFDKWLRKISHDYVTLERLSTVAGGLPVIGNIMALIDAVMDVVRVVEKYAKKEAAHFLDWVSLGINLIGVIPVPLGMSAARMSLRPALHLVRQQLARGTQNLGEALVAVLVTHLNARIAGEIETFVDKAMGQLPGILEKCAQKTDEIADSLVDVLNRCIGNKPLFDVAPPVTAESQVHNPKVESTWGRMLGAMARTQKRAANYVARKATHRLPEAAKAGVTGVIAALTRMKGEFRATLTGLANENTEQGIQWLLKRLLDAVRRHKTPRAAMVPAHKGAEVKQDKPGYALETVGKQAPARKAPKPNRACPAESATAHSISFATGAESFTHTDFVLRAPLPIEWSRTYRSDLGAYDQGNLGARWVTPYSTRVDVQGEGRQRGLVYHGVDGRSHRYPWLEVGHRHHDAVEEITLTRLTEGLLVLDFGKPKPEGQPSDWRESYELVDTCAGKVKTHGRQHFRLAALHGRNGVSIGLRYDHHVAGEQVLSDIVSKQGEDILAHVGVQPDAESGRFVALWEIKDGQLVRQLAAYDYDADGDLVQAQDENAAAWRYQYQDHLVTRYTDRTGRGMNLAYDGTGPHAKAIREWADDGSFDTRLEWDPNIRLTYVTDALGHETWHYYDIDGYPYRVVHPDHREEWFFRDAAKNVTRHIHPDGSTDDYRYDTFGHLVCQVRADGSEIHFEYDAAGRLTGIRDPEGGIWKRDYDPKGRLTEETDPRGHKTQYAYDAAGRLVKVTDAKGGVKKLAYTADGQLTRYTDCSSRSTQWEYDERGRVLKKTDAAGNVTQYRYTPISAEALARATAGEDNHPGRLEAMTHADGSAEQFQFDAEGRLLVYRDALQRSTRYRYTAAGLVAERIDALGQQLGYRWDARGRLLELRNENDQAYRFRYDAVGRLLEEVGFDEQRTEYRYDDATGVLAEVIEPGLRKHLAFDRMGRLVQRKATLQGQDEQVETFSYHPSGRLAQAENRDAKLQWFYDEAGNLVREHHHYQGEFHAEKRTAVWRHRYDELNQRIGTTRPGGHTLEWLTYGAGHVHGLMLDGQDVVGFERDALHREVHRLQANGLEQRQRFDPVGRLLEQQVARPQHLGGAQNGEGDFTYRDGAEIGTLAAIRRRYRYNEAGQLSTITDSRRGHIDYRYDPVGRLLQANSALGAETFAFDPAGNIAVPTDDTAREAHASVSRVLDNLLKDYAGTTYRYDERGHLVERVQGGQRSRFEWDGFGRLVRAITPRGVTHFCYDPLGRRLGKRSDAGVANDGSAQALETATLYGWDGDTLAFETRGPSAGNPDGVLTVHYVYEPGHFAPLLQVRRGVALQLPPTTDVKALMARNGGAYDVDLDPLWNGELDEQVVPFAEEEIAFYQCDHLGTPQELTDHQGQVAWAAQYKAWGEAKEVISAAARKAGIANPLRFQGQYFDEETGLHYNRYRYYDPSSGRFVSKDPIKLQGGVNLHRFAANPVQWIDPLGLAPGKAIVRQYHGDGRTGHYTVEVIEPSTASRMHTHQVQLNKALDTTIVDERRRRVMDEDSIVHSAEIPLPDADSAHKYQRSQIGKDTGTYDVHTNSCLTHVANVLRAGGEPVPEGAGGQMRYMRKKGFKVKTSED